MAAYENRFVFIFLQKDKDVANAQTNSKLVIKIKLCIFLVYSKIKYLKIHNFLKYLNEDSYPFFIIIVLFKISIFDFLKLSKSIMISGKVGKFCIYFAKFFIIFS